MMQYNLGQNEKKNRIIAETAFNPAHQGKCEAIFCMAMATSASAPQFEGCFGLKHVDLAPYKASSVVGTICNDYNKAQIDQTQVHKQADTLVLMLLMDDLFPHEIKTKNCYFYEALTLHDPSLSRSTHCVLAADLHEDETAYRFFEGCGRIDLGPVMTTSDASETVSAQL